MSDQEREFKIRITGDAEGIVGATKQAAGGLEDIKAKITDGVNPALARYTEKAAAATEGSDHMGISHRGLHRALGMIGPEASHVGTELLTAFSSPQMMGIMAVAGAVKLLDMAMQSLIEKDQSKIGAYSLASGFVDMRKVTTDARVSVEDFFRTLNEGTSAEEDLNEAMARSIALMKEQAEAANGQADADKELALAQLDKAKADGKITEAEYRAGKSDIEESAEIRKLEREKKAREDIIKLHREEAGKQNALAKEDAAKVPEAKTEADRTRLAAEANARQIKAAQANEKSYAQTNPEDMTPGLKASRERNTKLLEMFEGRQAGLQTAADAAKANLDKLESEAKTARKKADSLQATIDTEDELNRTKTGADEKILGTRRQARRTEAEAKAATEARQSPEGKLVVDVGQTEQMRSHGQQITAAQQSQEKALLELVAALGMNGPATLAALKGQASQLNDLTMKIRQLEARHRDTYNQ